MRIVRRVVLILVILVVLLGALALAGWGYLWSRGAARQVAARLEALYGGRMHLDNVDVGTRGSSLHGLRLYESQPEHSEHPWLTIEDTDTDVSAWDLLKGEVKPHHLTVSGAKLLLRFDKEGHLLTQLPTTGSHDIEWPTVQVKQGEVTIQQEGRPEMVVHGLSAELTEEHGRLVLTGAVVDPRWGDWSLNSHVAADKKSGAATLKTRGAMHVTQAMLNDLPLIPAKVWQEVQAEGDTRVELGVRFTLQDPEKERCHYRVALDPEHTTVHVPSIELTAHDARGSVAIEDEVVHLRKVHGQAAEGDIDLDGDLDFAHEPNKLNFAVRVRNLVVKELPRSWALPPQIEGRLTGQANLQIALVDGHPETSGTGEGVVNDARIAGQAAEPIQLRLHAAGRGYRFAALRSRPGNAPGAAKVLVASALAAPADPPTAASTGQDTFLPSRAVNWLMSNTMRGLDMLVQTGQTVMGYFKERPSAAPKPGQPPRYLEANLGMNNINLEQFIKGLGPKLPLPVTGRLTFHVHAAIPIDTSRDLKTYRVNGSATAPQLTVAGLELANVQARVTFLNGVLRLEEFRGDVPQRAQPGMEAAVAGNFNGTALLQLAPEGDLSAQLTLQNIPLARAMSLLPGEFQRAQGLVSGKLEFLSPAVKLRDVTAWKASGGLSTRRVQAFGWRLDNASTEFRLERGILALTQARGTLEGSAVSATGTLGLTEPFRVRAKLDLQDAELAAVQRLSPDLKPPVALAGRLNATANVDGTLRPSAVQTSGNGAAADMKVEGLTVGNLNLRWTSTADRLSLDDIRAKLYGGDVTGAGVIALHGAAAGNVKLTVKGVDVGRLQKDVLAIPFRLEGTAGGTLEAKMGAAGPKQAPAVNATMDLQAPSLRVQGIPTERLHGTVDYRQGAIDYRLQGESLGGTFDLNGKLPVGQEQPARPQPAAPPGGQGRLNIRDMRLSRLASALGVEALRPLGGLFNLDVTFQNEAGTWAPIGTGRFTLDRLRWGMTELSPRIQGNLRLDRDELRLVDLAGELGGGALRGAAAYILRQPERSWFSISLDQGQAARLLAPWPALAERTAGGLDLHVRGHLGREWRGAGRVLFTNGRIAGVTVNEWRIPLDFAFVPGRGRGELVIRDSTAELAMGRATGEATWTWGGESRLNGQLRCTGLNVQTLIRQLADTGQGGLGQVNGRITFAGDNVRSVNDVTADVEATVRQTQAQGLPVIFQALPFIAPGRSTSAMFDSGSLRARLNGGVLRVQRLGLEGRALKIFAEGTVTLEGRLNLEVTGTTGQYGVNPNLLRVLGLRLPVAGPIPVSLILQVTSALSNRLVHLRVTGTYRNPSIQIEPLSLLTQEAVYFFLNQAGVPLP
jgi:translocation and assembly module TamB